MLEIDVRDSRELQAAVLAVASVGKEIQSELRSRTKAMVEPEWQKGLAERAQSRMDHAVLVRSARTTVRNTNVVLRSGAVGKLKKLTGPTEFGGNREKVKTYTGRSPKGKRYTIKRHTARQVPPRYREGRVVYPTAKNMIPRLAALWVQTIIKTFYEQLGRK
ncbi:MAG: hypothetical protein J0H64_03730 [Actinobacteria bacterium]|nr:hypothetical protein [Actinomycetota bacterium]